MILALWNRWRTRRHARWLVLAAALITADVLVGSTIVAWEIALIREAW